MDSKDRKYAAGIEKSLLAFETVEEWADYISFLSKLLKALKQQHTTENWIPHDLKISILLSKCLSPNLPSGVHQKTLELYDFVFGELGTAELSQKVNVWIPGVLPIVQFASISIKPLTLNLYNKYLVTLPQNVLKSLIKPILSYLLPSIDDERSEFFEPALELIDQFKKVIDDDSLFWQSVFLIMITSDERRLGCLVWCTKRLPQLNIVVDEPENGDGDADYYRTQLQGQISKEQLAIISPEPGLLIRAFASSLTSDNLLIQRGFFDLLIKSLMLNSTILQKISPSKDLQHLIMSTVSSILKKDMSINRRVWSWLLGPETTTAKHQEYFQANGRDLLIDGLLKLINGLSNKIGNNEQKISSFKICLALMDRWEIGVEIIPKVLLPVLKSVEIENDIANPDYEEILRSASSLFDNVETLTIFSNFYQQLDNGLKFLNFAFQNFSIQEEEMIIHQLPILLVASLIKQNKTEEWFRFIITLLEFIPQRAFLPIELSDPSLPKLANADIVKNIDAYYEGSDVLNLPFKPTELSSLVLNLITDLFIKNIGTESEGQFTILLNKVVDLIPELSFTNPRIPEIFINTTFNSNSIMEISKLFIKFNFNNPFEKIKSLRSIVFQLCSLLESNGDKYQVEIVKSLQFLSFEVSSDYVEAAISSYLLTLDNFNQRLLVFNYIWAHVTDISFIDRPLHILLDELDPVNIPTNAILESWILNNVNSGHINIFFQLVTNKLHQSLDDPIVFTYHVSMLFKVLSVDVKRMIQPFKEELTVISSIEYKNENVSTYKDYVLFELNKFLSKKTQYDSKLLGSIFKLYELLLDGSETIFEDHITKVFDISQKFVINEVGNENYDEISIVLLDHLTKLTTLLINTHNQVTKLLIRSSAENGTPFLVEFLLSSFEKFNKPELLVVWIELLSTSLKFQDERIFEFVEPIALIILSKIDSIYKSDELSKDDVSVSLLLGISQEVLSLLRTYVVTLEINDTKDTSHADSGFFTSVVSGVFNGDAHNGKKTDDQVSDVRRVLIVCFKEAVETCFEIWKTSDSILKYNDSDQLTIKYQSMKLKHRSKILLESLYELEPVEVLKAFISIYGRVSETDQSATIFKLLHVLDGTRPQLTIPHIFKLVKDSVNQRIPTLSSLETSDFLISYTLSLQDDSIEDIFGECITFLRSIGSDLVGFKGILLKVAQFVAIIGEKLNRSKFGQQKKVRKEISEVFLKILPSSLNIKNSDISAAISSGINDVNDSENEDQNTETLNSIASLQALDKSSYEEICNSVKFIIPKLKFVVHDSDKQTNVISIILVNLLTPSFKSKKFPTSVQPYHMDLLNELIKFFPSSKSLKFLISEVFNDSNFFRVEVEQLPVWNSIIQNWLNEEVKDKILELLAKTTQSSGAANIFNWNENEQLIKAIALRKIAYLLLISEKDKHIILLKELFDTLDELSNQNGELSSLIPEIFTILRVVVLKFSQIHLYDYWTFIYTSLQRFFSRLLEIDQQQFAKLNSDHIFQACKLLDVLLVLKYEDFQEWIFIIDTINAIYKNTEIISLIDKIALRDDVFNGGVTEEKTSISDKLLELKGSRRPGLIGIRQVESISSLKPFFDTLSYYNYENIYSGEQVDYGLCEHDVYADLFNDDK